MSGLDIDLLDYLRLEIETDPTGLVNLVANPSGDLGGWGWVTPVAGSAMTKSGTRLRFTAPNPSAASWFYTENIAVAAGQYVAASWVAAATSAGFYRVKFEFLKADGSLISSSAQTGYLAASGSTIPAGPFLAPALTAYARLRFDFYSTNAGANPAASAWLEVYQVTVAKAATSGALGTLRTNLITNPSAETLDGGGAIVHWQAPYTGLAQATGGSGGVPAAVAGTKVAKYTAPANANDRTVNVGWPSNDPGSLWPVTPGKDYTFSISSRAATTGRFTRVGIRWYDASKNLLAGGGSAVVAGNNTAAWARFSSTGTAPAGAAYAQGWVLWMTTPTSGLPPAGEVHYLDAAMLEQASAAGTYFDGSTAAGGGWTYAWTGTAQASTATATSSNLAYVEPVPYLNVLSSSATISLNRKALDVGVIQAVVKDAALDPADSTLIRPGRSVRVMALNGTTALWEVLASGTLLKGHVDYDLRKPLAKQATISVSTVDANQVLANTNRPDGVATISALPYVLEGARVPWNVNGSGNQVAAATVASRNDQASALDQVILARDTALGYAWVTKEGVLTAYTDRTLDYYGTGTPTLDESVYSGLGVTFDTSDCINEVMFKYRRFNATTAEVEEVAYGPYRDAASIDQWGVQQATFTIHGVAEAGLAGLANLILAANATPARRINSVTIPIRTAADLVKTRALLDLYAKVRVVNADKALDQTLRVTGIQHTIGPRRWTMTLTFDRISTVASPIATTPQGGSDSDLEGVWKVPGLLNGWANYGNGWATIGYMRKNGIVYLRGLLTHATNRAQVIFIIPPGYRPGMSNHLTGIVTGNPASDLEGVNVDAPTGNVTGRPGGSGLLSLDGMSYPADQ